MTKMLVIELQDSRYSTVKNPSITLNIKYVEGNEVTFILILICRGKIKCTLIESVVNPMAEYLASNWTVRPIVVFQFVKVKRNGGLCKFSSLHSIDVITNSNLFLNLNCYLLK